MPKWLVALCLFNVAMAMVNWVEGHHGVAFAGVGISVANLLCKELFS